MSSSKRHGLGMGLDALIAPTEEEVKGEGKENIYLYLLFI